MKRPEDRHFQIEMRLITKLLLRINSVRFKKKDQSSNELIVPINSQQKNPRLIPVVKNYKSENKQKNMLKKLLQTLINLI